MTIEPARVCVFAGSGVGSDPIFAAAASELGAELGRRGLGLVFGGEDAGLMGVVADAAVAAGAEAIGVLPRNLAEVGTPHPRAEMRLPDSLAERKQLMFDLSGGFVALPGGLGTLDELAEAATWTQLGLQSKPLVLLETGGCWAHLREQLDSMVANGFLRPEARAIIGFEDSPAAALEALARGPRGA